MLESNQEGQRRKRAIDEPQSSTKLVRRNTTTICAQCGQLGHNKRTCKGQPLPHNQNAGREKLPVRRNNTEGETQGTQDASQPTMGTTTNRQGNTSTTQDEETQAPPGQEKTQALNQLRGEAKQCKQQAANQLRGEAKQECKQELASQAKQSLQQAGSQLIREAKQECKQEVASKAKQECSPREGSSSMSLHCREIILSVHLCTLSRT
ncbi:hypothetical protein RHSIM_Rhsim07G0046700 [Rhododendron simsii]|uniref:CCHC-type domain-containing protein n=1 Tax=Rhododendron simsii TaxID=118357 RepID=A0A834GNZ1_RHOSS|nr:hypothetical protein RHSIM_Rhsim07G0046700 [Rhododendron simsii]